MTLIKYYIHEITCENYAIVILYSLTDMLLKGIDFIYLIYQMMMVKLCLYFYLQVLHVYICTFLSSIRLCIINLVDLVSTLQMSTLIFLQYIISIFTFQARVWHAIMIHDNFVSLCFLDDDSINYLQMFVFWLIDIVLHFSFSFISLL